MSAPQQEQMLLAEIGCPDRFRSGQWVPGRTRQEKVLIKKRQRRQFPSSMGRARSVLILALLDIATTKEAPVARMPHGAHQCDNVTDIVGRALRKCGSRQPRSEPFTLRQIGDDAMDSTQATAPTMPRLNEPAPDFKANTTLDL